MRDDARQDVCGCIRVTLRQRASEADAQPALGLNPALVGRMSDAGVYRNVRGWERPSDHAPVWVDLRD